MYVLLTPPPLPGVIIGLVKCPGTVCARLHLKLACDDTNMRNNEIVNAYCGMAWSEKALKCVCLQQEATAINHLNMNTCKIEPSKNKNLPWLVATLKKKVARKYCHNQVIKIVNYFSLLKFRVKIKISRSWLL